jgi:riboflavin biosynthesis pyrimidine reductase
MSTSADASPQAVVEQPLRLRRLLPPGEPATVAEIVEQIGLWERPSPPAGRPRVLLNMVSTADGRATVAGRSGPLSNRADRELFHGLRSAVDAVLIGAATARVEGYGPIIRDPFQRRLRAQRGLEQEPLACIVSGRLALGDELPLLADPAARVAILTSSAASLPPTAAQVDYVRPQRDGALDLSAALTELRERFSVQMLLCEGGPHLSHELLAAGLVDELFLSVAPTLAGGEPTHGQALRILAGPELDPPVELTLLGALESGSQMFLRYGVTAPERVSRETTLSSSLARRRP